MAATLAETKAFPIHIDAANLAMHGLLRPATGKLLKNSEKQLRMMKKKCHPYETDVT